MRGERETFFQPRSVQQTTTFWPQTLTTHSHRRVVSVRQRTGTHIGAGVRAQGWWRRGEFLSLAWLMNKASILNNNLNEKPKERRMKSPVKSTTTVKLGDCMKLKYRAPKISQQIPCNSKSVTSLFWNARQCVSENVLPLMKQKYTLEKARSVSVLKPFTDLVKLRLFLELPLVEKL